jgi:uncharacterized RDD family membrane protein YckC
VGYGQAPAGAGQGGYVPGPGYPSPYGTAGYPGVNTAALPKAGFGARLAAYLIDGVLLYVVQYVLDTVAPGLGVSLGTLISLGYFVLMTGQSGQTLGKMLLGIKVVTVEGANPGYGKALVRWLGYIVSTLIIFIGFLMVAWDSQKQGLHDKIADTYVIRTR